MKRLALMALLVSSCFQAWKADGLYLCGGGCPEGMECDDGVCCRDNGSPQCPTRVPPSGRCADGSLPKTLYRDRDLDGYGNPAEQRATCGRPVLEQWVENDDDCDDGSAAAAPGGTESCDGRDNDCDGAIDEGLVPQMQYFRDLDGDGSGEASDTLMACATPPGYAPSSGDCAPMDNTRFPGATEVCNNEDDDCDGVRDDNVSVGVGGTCSDAGMGECAAGTLQCVGGAISCRPTKTPSRDICNTLDDDCDGMVDEQPDCGGPDMLLAVNAAVTGARDTGSNAQSQAMPTQCFGRTVGTGETWAPPQWSGSSDSFHVWYAEAPNNGTWDLSKVGLKLHLQFTTSMLRQNTTTPWNTFNQPVVLLCNADPTKFSRYRPNPATLMTSATVSVNTDMPLAGGNGWLLAQPGADLTQVKRVEVIVEPSSAPMVPSFTITFNNSTGFKP